MRTLCLTLQQLRRIILEQIQEKQVRKATLGTPPFESPKPQPWMPAASPGALPRQEVPT